MKTLYRTVKISKELTYIQIQKKIRMKTKKGKAQTVHIKKILLSKD